MLTCPVRGLISKTCCWPSLLPEDTALLGALGPQVVGEAIGFLCVPGRQGCLCFQARCKALQA